MGLVSWGIANLYDTVMQRAEVACLDAWRHEVLAPLSGDVLEVGAGTGVNLPHYPQAVTSLTLAEPDRHMRDRLKQKLATANRKVTVSPVAAEQLPFPDNTFDAVIATLVLCSVSDPATSLQEISRVLVPGGKLAIIEHVRAFDDGPLLSWQRRLEPLWRCCAGNCHLARDTFSTLTDAGFDCTGVRRDTMRGAFALVTPVIRGLAKKC